MEQTLAEKSYDYIRKKLAGGDLPPGQRLVNRVLADEIGGSVIPVREAIHRLASEVLSSMFPVPVPSFAKPTLTISTISTYCETHWKAARRAWRHRRVQASVI
jgi:DNA-binding transcriptional MocR family regulator